MAMSDMSVPEDSTVCFTCCPNCCHAAPTPTTPEDGVYCITSSKNKQHSVALAAQMVGKAFKQTVWDCEKWPLNKKTSVLTLWSVRPSTQ